MATNRLAIAGRISGATATTTFILQADEISTDPVANTSVVRAYLVATTQTNNFANSNPQTLNASVNGVGLAVDARIINGTGGWTQGPWDITVAHAADGSKSIALGLDTGSIGWFIESGASSTSTMMGLATLVAVPGTPTAVTATRVSDTSCTVAFTPNYAGNAVPTATKVLASVDGGAFAQVLAAGNASSLPVSTLANHKYLFKVTQGNSAGTSAESAASVAYFTTPAAPTGVSAAKDASLNIVVSWVDGVPYSEHQMVVEHGTVTGGVTTWDGSPLAVVAAGSSSYTHVSPNPAASHVYRVSAKNTDTGALVSAAVVSNTVQLLVAPNKPTVPALALFADKGKAFVLGWAHNPVDTTPQTAYEVGYSTNGGTTWSTTGKVASVTPSKTFAASTYNAGDALTVRVRTWGQAATGGSDGTGASPWSDPQTVTFKTRPSVSIIAPANAGTWVEADVTVQLGFSQAEGATFVQATITLLSGTTELETVVSTTLAATALASRVADGSSYSVKVTVLDSNGLVSNVATSTFAVAYTLPVEAEVSVSYLADSGIAQINLAIPIPGVGEAAAVSVSIDRTINGSRETIVDRYPIEGASLTVLDTTPTINGTNSYRVRTYSDDGATADVIEPLVTTEKQWAFLSTGAGFATIVSFYGNLRLAAAPARSTALVPTAGRERPIALFGNLGSLEVSGSATLLPDEGSTPTEVEQFVQTAGVTCFRGPDGRRVFGAVAGSVSSPSSRLSEFQFKVTEAS